MTYQETIEFLFSQLPAYHRIGKAAYKNDLRNTLILDEHLGNPHRKFRSVHVTGTNGKGSVSHMTASILQEAGYKTGLYTSPHLRDFRERIKINGEMIPESEVIGFVEKNKDIIEELKPSFFEMTVGMAFDYFARERVDVAVVEVGLGGRLDSTNIITPVLSVITNIGHDHMDLLGDTLEKIAVEKAGIIKPGVPVVISESQNETKPVFIEKAGENRSEIIFADSHYKCMLDDVTKVQYGARAFSMTRISDGFITRGLSPLAGNYQSKNLQAVFASCGFLENTYHISAENITEGIEKVIVNTGLHGRWQVLGKSPLTICDTGHNKEGLEYVLEQVRQVRQLRKGRLHIVLGFVNDKDLGSVLPLFPTDAVYYFTKANVPRALDEEKLRDAASAYGLEGRSYPSVFAALSDARLNAGSSDMIFVGGSTFIVAEVV